MLTQCRLKESLHYSERTGVFTWLVSKWTVKKGDVAGSLYKGYIRVRVDKRGYRASRLAFLYVRGIWPSKQIDHKNRDRADNSWDNLREADDSQQNGNKPLQRNNTSGVRGVSFWKTRGKWRACLAGRYVAMGNSKEEVSAAYQKAAVEKFGEFMVQGPGVVPRR